MLDNRDDIRRIHENHDAKYIYIYILGKNIFLLKMYEINLMKFWKKLIIIFLQYIFKMLQKHYSISKTK